jgi:hypothetical protein
MNVAEMMDLLGLRLEDANKGDFPDLYKLKTLGNSQVKVSNNLHNAYLTELEVSDTNKSLTSGSLSISSLAHDVLRGGQGIRKVKVTGTGGLWLTMIDLADVKKTENTFLAGTVTNPLGYVFQNKINVIPTSVSAIDVYYLRVPAPLLYTFAMSAASPASTTEFLGASTLDSINTADDFWNGAVVYSIGKNTYHVITDYDHTGNAKGERLFTVSPAAGTNFGTDTFYFITHGFDALNLSGVTCQLNESLHELVVTLAEAECWAMNRNLDRRNAALETAFGEIKMLNARYESEKPEGIGTDRKGR